MTKTGKQAGTVQGRSLPHLRGFLFSHQARGWALALAVIGWLAGAGAARAQYIRWGPFSMNLGAFAELEYTDNVNNSEDNKESDVKLRLGPTLNGSLILSPYIAGGQPLVLTVGLNLGFEFSLTGHASDTFSSPVSLAIALPIYVESWVVTFSDGFSFSNDPLESSLGYGGSAITSFDNTASVMGSRQFGRLGWSMGVSREDTWYPDLSEEDLTIHTFSGTPSYAITRQYSVFLANTYGIVDYDSSVRRDSVGWSSSLGVSGQITRNLNGSISVGWSHSTLEATHQPGNVHGKDNIDGISSQVDLSFARALRPNTAYTVSFYRSPGVTAVMRDSDITEITGSTFTITHRLNRNLTLTPQVGYDYMKDVSSSVKGQKLEAAGLIRAGLALDRAFNRKLAGYIRYVYQSRDSNVNGDSYDTNRITVGMNYTF